MLYKKNNSRGVQGGGDPRGHRSQILSYLNFLPKALEQDLPQPRRQKESGPHEARPEDSSIYHIYIHI